MQNIDALDDDEDPDYGDDNPGHMASSNTQLEFKGTNNLLHGLWL